MKFYNKRKNIRKNWTTVIREHNGKHSPQHIKIECQRYESKGRFYFESHSKSIWWFEYPDDATYFKLKWC